MAFVKVATVDEIPKGKMKVAIVDGKKVLVANVDGKLYAMQGVCSHAGGPLALGVLAAKHVTCPWHGSVFDVTSGKVVRGPAKKDVPKYKIKVKGNDILVEA